MAHSCDFIVLGAGRSGTSLLMAQINQHSQLACALESGAVPILSNPVKGLLRRDSPNNRMRRFAQHCDAAANKSTKAFYGNKITTEQLLLPLPEQPEAAIKNFLKYFSNKPIIFLVRDGRTCIPSKVKRGEKSLPEAIFFWKAAAVMLEYLKAHHNKLLVLKYEDLLNAPEKLLLQVCGFLGVPWEVEMLQATNSTVLPEMYRNPKILKEKALPPTPEAWHIQIRDKLQYLGYL